MNWWMSRRPTIRNIVVCRVRIGYAAGSILISRIDDEPDGLESVMFVSDVVPELKSPWPNWRRRHRRRHVREDLVFKSHPTPLSHSIHSANLATSTTRRTRIVYRSRNIDVSGPQPAAIKLYHPPTGSPRTNRTDHIYISHCALIRRNQRDTSFHWQAGWETGLWCN